VAQVLADAKGRGVQTNSRVLFMLLLAASGVELVRGQVAVLFAEVAELRARCPPDRRRACFGLAELSISCSSCTTSAGLLTNCVVCRRGRAAGSACRAWDSLLAMLCVRRRSTPAAAHCLTLPCVAQLYA